MPARGSKVSRYADQLPFSCSGTFDRVKNLNLDFLELVFICTCVCVRERLVGGSTMYEQDSEDSHYVC